MEHHTHPLVWIGNLITGLCTVTIFTDADFVMKTIAFAIGVGAGASTWIYNYKKIKQLDNDNNKR